MQLATRNLMDRAFTTVSGLSIVFMGAALLILLVPIVVRGLSAFFFYETVEHRIMVFEELHRGNENVLRAERAAAEKARTPVYAALRRHEEDIEADVRRNERFFEEGREGTADLPAAQRASSAQAVQKALHAEIVRLAAELEEKQDRISADEEAPESVRKGMEHLRVNLERLRTHADTLQEKGSRAVLDGMDPLPAAHFESFLGAVKDKLTAPRDELEAIKERVRDLLGPLPSDPEPELMRSQYGVTRWDRALVKRKELLYEEQWVAPENGGATGTHVRKTIPRRQRFAGTALEPLFDAFTEENLERMLRPQFTFYWRFLTDVSYDNHLFGGIWPELLGTFYLALGAMLFALPIGVIAAIYFAEYAKESTIVSVLRSCVSTLAGVPSIVFGLFGLAFFIDTLDLTDNKSVLVGALTLGLLILPTIIRASEEAILAVPHAYKEAAMGLGSSHWHTIVTVILPAALPGILTGIVISMGRAAGETAPIMLTAAVGMGSALSIGETLSQPTPALPWSIYYICTSSEVAVELDHVKYGMVLTLVGLVLVLNGAAIVLRARIQKRLRG